VSNRWRQGEKETYNGDKSTTNSEKDFAGGVIVVEDDVLWGEGRENMVVGKRERWEAGWRTDGQVVAASSAVGVGSSRGHGTPDTKHKKHKNTNRRASSLSGVLLIPTISRSHPIIKQILINK